MNKENRTDTEEREAKHGEKMISINVRLWTDEIASEKGKIRPKHAWAYGTIRLERNSSHGIESGKAIPFNSLRKLPETIEKVLTDAGIVLH